MLAGVRAAAKALRPRRHGVAMLAMLLFALSASLALEAALGASADQLPSAHVARTLSVMDEGYLHLLKSSGSELTDEGPAHGTIPGKVRIHFVYNGDPTVSSRITIYGRSGTIQARASARLSSPTSSAPSFKGNLTITGGTGRYARAHGSGHLYGVFYRRSFAMTVQTRGTLTY